MQRVNNICKAYQINDVWLRSGPSVAVTTLLLYDGFQHCPSSTYDLKAKGCAFDSGFCRRRGRGEGAARARRGRGEEATGGGTLAYLENWYNSNGGLRRHTPPRLRLWPRNEAAVFCCANSVSKALAS